MKNTMIARANRGQFGQGLAFGWRIVAVLLAALLTMLGMPATAHAAGTGDTAATILKGIEGGPAVYEVGDTVTYRLIIQCSSLVGPCGIGTVTDAIDPNLKVSLADVVLPTTTQAGTEPPPMTKTLDADGNLVITVGTSAQPFMDGPSMDILVVAKVKSYPVAGGGKIPNSASIAITDGDGETSGPVVIEVKAPLKDWGLVKTVSGNSTPAPGELVTFAINFTRPTKVGGTDISGATLIDDLPAGLEFVSATSQYPTVPGAYDSASHSVKWDVPALSAGSELNCGASGCTSYFTAYVTLRVPPNGLTSEMPAAGTTYKNKATAEVTYVDGTKATLDASASVSTEAPVIKKHWFKSGPATVAPDGAIAWRLYAKNEGNVSWHNVSLVDTLPVDGSGAMSVENLELHRAYVDYQPVAPRGQVVTVDFSTDGTTWTDTYAWDSSQNSPTTHAVPSGAKYVRLSLATLAPGATMEIMLRGHVPATTSLDASISNCALLQADELPAQTPSCVTTTVDPKVSRITPYKTHTLNAPGQDAVVPGEVFTWKIGFNAVGSLPISTVTLSDRLPKEFEFLGVTCFTTYGMGGGLDGAVSSSWECPEHPIPAYTAVSQADGTTLITFKDISLPDLANQENVGYSIQLKVRVRPGTSIQSYTNEVRVLTNDAITKCEPNYYKSAVGTDTTDIDGDGVTDEEVCLYPDKLPVVEAAAVELTKWDKGTLPNVFEGTGTATPPSGVNETECPAWQGYTRYPCVAVTMPGESFDYRLRLQNLGNVPLTDYVVYDILPVVGDTGVGQLLSNGQRGTEWSPELTGPVTLNGLSTTTNSGYLAEYNLTSNPCRPELNTATADASWQASCNDSWYTAGTLPGGDWAKVKSFRITMFADGQTWAPAGLLVFDVPMKAPLSAPQSKADPLDLSVAWNSAAQRIYRTSVTGNKWLKPSEPRKVGIIVPFTLIKVSVGDYVWYDEDGDGVQALGEAPAKGVKVVLYDADGNQVDETTTDEDGYYWFVNLEPETKYSLQFVKPAGYLWTTQDSATGTNTTDSDVDANGRVAFTSASYEVGGTNNQPGAPDKTDDPTLDAGLVKYVPPINLVIAKDLTTKGPFYEGGIVEFTVTPSNEGPADARPGWSVVEVPQTGLTVTGLDGGAGYTCTLSSLTCVSSAGLAAGKSGAPIKVTAKIASDFVGALRNVAYVVPAKDEVVETNPLVVPRDALVDTRETGTDNDAQAELKVDSLVSVGDYVWWDHDRDGMQDDAEPPVPGVTVNLLDASGALVKTTATSAAGYYAFADLVPGTSYVIEFVKPSGASFTSMGILTDAAADAKDSDADVATGKVAFVAPATGANLTAPGKADNPTLDAGLVSFNLLLDKQLASLADIYPEDQVTFTLTPRNAGPSAALAGWSISELVPANTTLVWAAGEGYSCAGSVCTATSPLAAGASGPVLTVVVKVSAEFSGILKNVAYVSPAPGDVPETNPLAVPGGDTDTAASLTDNDAQAEFTVLPGIVEDDTDTDGDGDVLAFTGADGIAPLLFVGMLALATGLGLRLRSRQPIKVRRL